MSRTTQTGSAWLPDRGRLDEVAADAMTGRTLDLVDVHRQATVYRRRRNRVRAGLALATAAAAALMLLFSPISTRLAGGEVARRPSGPGTLPDRIYTAPDWLPSVTDSPIGRVALVLAQPRGPQPDAVRDHLVLVSADGAEYRSVPGRTGFQPALSADGRWVAWSTRTGGSTQTTARPVPARLRWLETAHPRLHQADVTVPGRPTEIIGLAWSPDDRWILVSLQYQEKHEANGFRMGGAVALVDTGTGAVTRVCSCGNGFGVDGTGRILATVGVDPAQLRLPAGTVAGSLPDQPDVQPAGSSGIAPLLLSPDGNARLVATKNETNSFGGPDQWQLAVIRRDSAAARSMRLGEFIDVEPLAWDGARTGWLLIETVSQSWQVWHVQLDAGRGTVLHDQVIRRGDSPSGTQVVAMAHDLAVAGRVVPASQPSWPRSLPMRLRALITEHWTSWLGPVLLLALLAGAARGVARRWARWRQERAGSEVAG